MIQNSLQMSFGEHFRPVNGIILQIKYMSIKASTNLEKVISGKDISINLGQLHDPGVYLGQNPVGPDGTESKMEWQPEKGQEPTTIENMMLFYTYGQNTYWVKFDPLQDYQNNDLVCVPGKYIDVAEEPNRIPWVVYWTKNFYIEKIWFFTTIRMSNQDPITSSEIFNFKTLSEALQSDTDSTESNNTTESKQPATE